MNGRLDVLGLDFAGQAGDADDTARLQLRHPSYGPAGAAQQIRVNPLHTTSAQAGGAVVATDEKHVKSGLGATQGQGKGGAGGFVYWTGNQAFNIAVAYVHAG